VVENLFEGLYEVDMEFFVKLFVKVFYFYDLIPFWFRNHFLATTELMLLLELWDIFVNNDQTLDQGVSDVCPEYVVVLKLDFLDDLLVNVIQSLSLLFYINVLD